MAQLASASVWSHIMWVGRVELEIRRIVRVVQGADDPRHEHETVDDADRHMDFTIDPRGVLGFCRYATHVVQPRWELLNFAL